MQIDLLKHANNMIFTLIYRVGKIAVYDRASHGEVCASLKTTIVVLVLGEAAGILASLSIDSNVCLKDIKYKDLKEKTCRK